MEDTYIHQILNKTHIVKEATSVYEFQDKVRINPGELPEKKFAPRDSLLTNLYEDRNIRTVYNVCLAILCGLFIATAADDYLNKQKILLGIPLIMKGFSRMHFFLILWSCMFASSVLIYGGFKYWAIIRTKIKQSPVKLKCWDYSCLTIFVMYYPGLLYLSTTAAVNYELAIAESMIYFLEVTRFLMKIHAFVRSNVPRVLTHDRLKKKEKLYPEFSKFLYFSFAPTLVYRDKYPRSTKIRWKFVGLCFLEVVGVAFLVSLLLERYGVPFFKEYGIKPFAWQNIVIKILENTAAAMLGCLGITYALIHSWQNAFAEMLRFSDRMFYKDWWTSSSYIRFYRTWNTIVHDWLYTYIYKDFYENVFPKNKAMAKLIVFLASSLFHDYLIGFAFRCYIPVFFLFFCGGGLIVHFCEIKNDTIGNVFLWYTYGFGISVLIHMYILEYYSRINCPVDNNSLFDYFVPRMFSCNK